MLTILIRSILIYFIVLFCFRTMGKRQLGQLQPFELVLTLIIADLATLPMGEMSIPLVHGLVPIFALLLVHFFLAFITRSSIKLSHIFSGKPVIVINEKGIDFNALKQLAISVEDVMESLRGCGYFSVQEVLFAIMETNGKISVLPKAEYQPLQASLTKTEFIQNTYPVAIIIEGKIINENFERLNVKKETIINFIKKQKIPIKQILILTIDNNGEVYFQQKYKKYKTLKM